jgi:plasmid maintenance system antidote protein VapI
MRKVESELKETMRIKGISAVELSKKLNIPYSRLNSYLNGYVKMPEEIRKKIDIILMSNKVDNSDEKTTGTELKKRMKEIDLKMTLLSELIDVKYFTLSCYLTNKLKIPGEVREKIEKAIETQTELRGHALKLIEVDEVEIDRIEEDETEQRPERRETEPEYDEEIGAF